MMRISSILFVLSYPQGVTVAASGLLHLFGFFSICCIILDWLHYLYPIAVQMHIVAYKDF